MITALSMLLQIAILTLYAWIISPLRTIRFVLALAAFALMMKLYVIESHQPAAPSGDAQEMSCKPQGVTT